jgi:hypothetical protein
VVSFTATTATLRADIRAFDTAADATAVRFTQVVAVVQRNGDRLVVSAPISVMNTSNRAYIGLAPAPGEIRHSLVIPLPAGVQTVQYMEGIQPQDADLTGRGVLFRVPLEPGSRDMLLRYEIPIAATRYLYSWRSDFVTDRFDLLLNALQAQVMDGTLQDQGTIPFQGRSLRRLSAQDVAPGIALEAMVTHLPFFDTAQALRWAALGLGLLLGVLLAALALRRVQAPPTKEALATKRAQLLAEIATIDGRPAGGAADQRQRERKLAQLVALTEALREDQR